MLAENQNVSLPETMEHGTLLTNEHIREYSLQLKPLIPKLFYAGDWGGGGLVTTNLYSAYI